VAKEQKGGQDRSPVPQTNVKSACRRAVAGSGLPPDPVV
jgi:hypothetical protein